MYVRENPDRLSVGELAGKFEVSRATIYKWWKKERK